MGFIRQTNYTKIERVKVYFLIKKSLDEWSFDEDTILATFLSLDNLKKYVKELLRRNKDFKIDNSFGGVYHRMFDTYAFLIEERELDPDIDEETWVRNIPINSLEEES